MTSYFDARLIPKCHDRLDKAKESLFRCRNASTFDEFSSQWSSFLINTGSILNALDTGSKSTPQGRQWYGGIKRAGRADPLVSYMHQSRNAEEHGADTQNAPRSLLPFGLKDPETGEIDWDFGIDWGSGCQNEDGSVSYDRDPNAFKPARKRTIVIGASPGGPALRPARDERFGTVIWPPDEHLGKRISNNDPLAVGDLYLAYLEDLISKAESAC